MCSLGSFGKRRVIDDLGGAADVGVMALLGLAPSDVVPVATDVLQTNVQKENTARVKADLDAKELQAPEMNMRDRVRLGASAPEYTQGFSPANATQYTAGIPLKG
jgi:hypothetical protein